MTNKRLFARNIYARYRYDIDGLIVDYFSSEYPVTLSGKLLSCSLYNKIYLIIVMLFIAFIVLILLFIDIYPRQLYFYMVPVGLYTFYVIFNACTWKVENGRLDLNYIKKREAINLDSIDSMDIGITNSYFVIRLLRKNGKNIQFRDARLDRAANLYRALKQNI